MILAVPRKRSNIVLGQAAKTGRHKKDDALSNHLGNVKVIVSDRKIFADSDGDGVAESRADVLASYSYYPFGMLQPGRAYMGSGDNELGFNGYEKDDELAGQGKMYTTTWRPYDSQLGRWWATDPREAKYPAYSPYTFT